MPVSYTVQAGDTLWKIARKFYGDPGRFPLIVAANAITNPDRLTVGQELVIPDATMVGASPVTSPSTGPVAGAPATSNPTARLNEQRLARLHPILAIRAHCMIDLCAYAEIPILVTHSLRTWEEQDGLYAIGRTIPPIGKKHIVTNAKGGQSYHNFGLAFDIVVLDSMGKANWDAAHPSWKRAAGIGKSLDLEWGGDWTTFKDLPHFQYVCGLTTAECRELYPSGLEAIWAKVT
ncbi:MAG: M15 family metallopeptidase [Nitrospiraceae bacterium]